MMFFYLYEITNNITQDFYIGVHKTKNMDDGYMGSGTRLKRSIDKYGLENFRKDVMAMFDDEVTMFEAERTVVNEQLLQDVHCLNLKVGGSGGWSFNQLPVTKRPNYGTAEYRRKRGQAAGAAAVRARKRIQQADPSFFKRVTAAAAVAVLSEESKQKRRDSFERIAHQSGSSNSQFGTMWITDGVVNHKIAKDSDIPEGFRKGRSVQPPAGQH